MPLQGLLVVQAFPKVALPELKLGSYTNSRFWIYDFGLANTKP